MGQGTLSENERTEIADKLRREGNRIAPVLEELLPRDEAGYISEAIWHHMGTGGKRVRPALCLIACRSLGGDSSDALYFAAGVEIIHNMFLVHDDLEDGDRVRRDEPTVWVKYGAGNAVNIGDYMHGKAHEAVLKSPVDDSIRVRLCQAFDDTYLMTCRGQALDLNCRASLDFTVDDYMELVTLKTGHYLALGMVGGAIVAGAGEEVIEKIKKLGRNMGPAFQIRDDLLDLTRGKGRGGVEGNDIREGKPSILYAHSLQAAAPGDRRRLVEIMNKNRSDTTDADVQEAVGIWERAGSLDYARETAEKLTRQALETLEEIPFKDKPFFRQIVRFMTERTT